MIPWYGLMYLLAFGLIWFLIRWGFLFSDRNLGLAPSQLDTFMVWTMIGTLAGGRLGYIFFYEPGFYFSQPEEMIKLWRGGMSFHGGLLGTVFSVRLLAGKKNFWPLLDRLAFWVPLGLFLGRMGNFLNGELWGTQTTWPIGLVFEGAGSGPRHPVQIYEALWEGPCLWFLLFLRIKKTPCPSGRLSVFFAIFYSLGRFGLEFVREPDAFYGYLAWGWLTMGQLLCLLLGFLGLALWLAGKSRGQGV